MRSLALMLTLTLLGACDDTRRIGVDGGLIPVDANLPDATFPDSGPTDAAPIDASGPRCGDDIRQGVEQCDGADLDGQTCDSLDRGEGSLACTASCRFDTSACESCSPACTGRMCGEDGCGGSCGTCGTERRCADGACVLLGGGLILTEVYYDAPGADDQLEWVEISNTTGSAIDLSGYSIGNGGVNYLYSTFQLSGIIPPGGCWVVGGPISSADNGFPIYQLAQDFNPDIQNGGVVADGVALFDVPASAITASTVPIDAVLYGEFNDNDLLDETGLPGAVDVGNAVAGESIRRTSSGWIIDFPDPNDCWL